MNASPVVIKVSQATRLKGSSARQASTMASDIWSAILSGWPSVTDSEVNKKRSWELKGRLLLMISRSYAARAGMGGAGCSYPEQANRFAPYLQRFTANGGNFGVGGDYAQPAGLMSFTAQPTRPPCDATRVRLVRVR